MIIITGASKGIGNYLFNEFRSLGHTVYGTYYSTRPNNDENLGFLEQVDIANQDNVKTWIDKIKRIKGGDGYITRILPAI